MSTGGAGRARSGELFKGCSAGTHIGWQRLAVVPDVFAEAGNERRRRSDTLQDRVDVARVLNVHWAGGVGQSGERGTSKSDVCMPSRPPACGDGRRGPTGWIHLLQSPTRFAAIGAPISSAIDCSAKSFLRQARRGWGWERAIVSMRQRRGDEGRRAICATVLGRIAVL